MNRHKEEYKGEFRNEKEKLLITKLYTFRMRWFDCRFQTMSSRRLTLSSMFRNCLSNIRLDSIICYVGTRFTWCVSVCCHLLGDG